MSLKAFAGMIFRHCPGLAHLLNDKHVIFAQFSAYKQVLYSFRHVITVSWETLIAEVAPVW